MAGNEEAYSAGEAIVREVGKGELALIIEAEVLVAGLVAGLVAAQGHGSQVVVGYRRDRWWWQPARARARRAAWRAHVCESEVVFGKLIQAQSCVQKRLVSELPLTCG